MSCPARHEQTIQSPRWPSPLSGSGPALPATYRLGLTFEVILLSDVWHHVTPGGRARAARKLFGLLRLGDVPVLTLRRGPAAPERAPHPTSPDEMDRPSATSTAPSSFGGSACRTVWAAPRCPRPTWRCACRTTAPACHGGQRQAGNRMGGSTRSMSARRRSYRGGSMRCVPSSAGSSSVAKPGGSVATSNNTPPGSRK